jgi:hypothetical protein
MRKHCCEAMARFAEPAPCEEHDQFECPDNLIYYSEEHGRYGIIVHDGGTSFVTLNFCPWCGTGIGDGGPERMIDVSGWEDDDR